MSNKFWLPTPTENVMRMNLQLFGGEDGDLDQGNEEELDTDEQEDGADGEPERRAFTDDELSKFVAKSTKKAMAKFLREIGFTPGSDTETVKNKLLELAKSEDAQRPEGEKVGTLTGKVDALAKSLETANARALAAERMIDAIKAGVPADKVDKYVKLAESYMDDEDDDFTDAVKAALKDFPASTQERRGSAGAGANPPPEKKRRETELNAGQEAAQRRRAQMKRSQDALAKRT